MFYFAWVDKTETTFGPSLHREDELVFAFRLEHLEGESASLELQIRNPSENLLDETRKQWAWLSWERGPGDVVPLFFGRLLGVPQDIQEEVVTLQLIARPADYEDQKAALAETLKFLPYWDPVFISAEQRNDPDHVLESRTQMWHVDRVTHQVTVSDIINGEDGTAVFTEEDFFADSVSVQHSLSPARKIILDAEISWNQSAGGNVNLTSYLKRRLESRGSMSGGQIITYTGHGLEKEWPKRGTGIGSGWQVSNSRAVAPLMKAPLLTTKALLDELLTPTVPSFLGEGATYEFRSPPLFFDRDGRAMFIPLWYITPTFNIRYDARRSFTERVHFEMSADVQPLLTEPGEEEIIRISVGNGDAGEQVDLESETSGNFISPIRDLRRRSYLKTDRGHNSLEYLIALARAKLLQRARAVNVSIDCRFEDAVDLSCRKNAIINDPRLFGGIASGKIVGYSLVCEGDTGDLHGEVTIGCTVGRGNSVEAAPGVSDYVEEGYVGEGYQTYTGQFIMPFPGEITYEDYSKTQINDDGVDFLRMTPERVIIDFEISGGYEAQVAVLANRTFKQPEEVINALNTVYDRIALDLVPLERGPFETEFNINLGSLMVPKMIDLEGTS